VKVECKHVSSRVYAIGGLCRVEDFKSLRFPPVIVLEIAAAAAAVFVLGIAVGPVGMMLAVMVGESAVESMGSFVLEIEERQEHESERPVRVED